ncbi:MAG: trehalose synthase, partial [Sphingomonas bacterium]|nr:trehalose synthase [Sphingomonas bacterium]
LDQHYPDRMLLAEANMWPEDTQQYFGADGDECHMAFHFPLMPRMYMAVAQEDRFPITDIMRQTPDIPANCQWAIFLRNHDELTLEMVTDAERDYLWNTYASDRRARINLGIRRRLAPLMENDRRRIELMNALLLSMPGTPVMYYGDEIGMGDNFHLGDRDGVRTPMQWSPDRNAGFSRANPAALTLPAIMDPVYGYEAVNVEAQAANSHSLLNWVKRMLAVRREFKAFGRGTQRFLRPANRKILAFVREHEDETILCVANMSRSPQAVELDLGEFAGRTPLELSGRNAFPAIGQLPYLLTLPAYGFYWFSLRGDMDAPGWSSAAPAVDVEHHTFVLREGLADLSSPRNQQILEQEVLPAYVRARRWFQGKDAEFQSARILRTLPLPGEGDLLLTEVAVTTSAGTSTYAFPVGVAWEGAASGPFAPNLALARVRRGRTVGLLTDGFATPEFARSVLRALGDGARVPLEDGELRFTAYRDLGIADDAALEWSAAEQSNSSMVIGEHAVLKLLRKLVAGVHPEAEMTRVLTERGFARTAPLLGEVARIGADGEPVTLMLLQGFVYNQGDGWQWTLDNLERAIDDHSLSTEAERQPAFENYGSFARIFGQRLAEMHEVLARPSDDAAFTPETAGAADVAAWGERVRSQLERAFALVEDRAAAGPLLARRDALLAKVAALAEMGAGSLRTRIHGDLHLGQVLVTGGDVTIIDFEGEPTRTLDERRAKDSPARDVAGVLRSFDYAAAMAERSGSAQGDVAHARSVDLVDRFRRSATESFLDGYRAGGGDVPEALIDLFLIEKAAYEIAYEAANRPEWLDVPLRGLAAIADRLIGGDQA